MDGGGGGAGAGITLLHRGESENHKTAACRSARLHRREDKNLFDSVDLADKRWLLSLLEKLLVPQCLQVLLHTDIVSGSRRSFRLIYGDSWSLRCAGASL